MEKSKLVKNLALKVTEKTLRHVAEKSVGVQCSLFSYEAKMPQALRKESKN